MSIRTPLARVKGLGSAKDGTEHFWSQRVSALALIPLMVWFIYSLVTLSTGTYDMAMDWFLSPVNSLLVIGFTLVSFYHGYLGMRVVIEDYVHREFVKVLLLILWQYVSIAAAAVCLFSVLSIYLKGYALFY